MRKKLKIINRLFHKACLNNEGNEADAVAIYFDESPLNRTQASDHDGLGRTFGVVTDEQSGDPLYEVSVRIVDGKSNLLWSGKTDKDGKWRSANISIGNYTFLFDKAGYILQELAHEVVDFQDTQLDVKLVK
jgi:5-hydroxyisourate hydrolase-like protein (transthyretin family)